VRRDFLFGTLLQAALDAIRDRLERADADGAFLARLEQARNQLLAIEALARSVLFHNHVRDLVDPLVARETLAALEALAAAADDFALFRFARVDDLVAEVPAVG